jgi:hypothetical protein
MLLTFFSIKDTWEFIVDNAFAGSFAEYISGTHRDALAAIEKSIKKPQLCAKCEGLNMCDPEFTITYTISYLEERENLCDLCTLFYKAGRSSGLRMLASVQFRKEGSILQIDGGGPPVLSIVAGLGMFSDSASLH